MKDSPSQRDVIHTAVQSKSSEEHRETKDRERRHENIS